VFPTTPATASNSSRIHDRAGPAGGGEAVRSNPPSRRVIGKIALSFNKKRIEACSKTDPTKAHRKRFS
jgi:hypothetical protein